MHHLQRDPGFYKRAAEKREKQAQREADRIQRQRSRELEKNPNIAYIYCLTLDDVPYYVGKTVDVPNRMRSHQYAKEGFKYFVIDCVPYHEWEFWEKHYISLYFSWGFNLSNISMGGIDAELLLKYKKTICINT
jgi:hypothetical protein